MQKGKRMKTKLKLILSVLLMASTFVYAAGNPDKDNSTVIANPAVVPEQHNSSTVNITLKDSNGFPVRNAHFFITQTGEGAQAQISDVEVVGYGGSYKFTVIYDNSSDIDIVKTIAVTANNKEIATLHVVFKAL